MELQDALGFLRIKSTEEGELVKIATIIPFDTGTKKVVIGGQRIEEYFIIPRKDKEILTLSREELLQFYTTHRWDLIHELDGEEIVVWSPIEKLEDFLKALRGQG